MTHIHLFYIEFENLEDSDIVFFFRFIILAMQACTFSENLVFLIFSETSKEGQNTNSSIADCKNNGYTKKNAY
jgi:hypothetical protein